MHTHTQSIHSVDIHESIHVWSRYHSLSTETEAAVSSISAEDIDHILYCVIAHSQLTILCAASISASVCIWYSIELEPFQIFGSPLAIVFTHTFTHTRARAHTHYSGSGFTLGGPYRYKKGKECRERITGDLIRITKCCVFTLEIYYLRYKRIQASNE